MSHYGQNHAKNQVQVPNGQREAHLRGGSAVGKTGHLDP